MSCSWCHSGLLRLYFSDTRTGCIRLRGKKGQVEKMQRSVEAILEKHEKGESSVDHIKKTRGCQAYLRALGAEDTVRYPSYWKRVQKGTVDGRVKRKLIDPQSSAYNDIESIIQRTWDASKVGHGQDAVNLQHSGIVVKKIWSVENPVLFREFDAKKKEICLRAADNRCRAVEGLLGEHAILTHHRGNYCKISVFKDSNNGSNNSGSNNSRLAVFNHRRL